MGDSNIDSKGNVTPVLPSEQRGGSDGGGVLSPADLDIAESPHVAEIEHGRYVVSPDSQPNVPTSVSEQDERRSHPTETASGESQRAEPADTDSDSGQTSTRGDEPRSASEASSGRRRPARPQSPEAARTVLANELARSNTRYALDVVSDLDDRTNHHRTASNDVVGTFDDLILWYAHAVATDTPTTRALSILLANSDFSPPPTKKQLRQIMASTGLTRSDSIGDLLDELQ